MPQNDKTPPDRAGHCQSCTHCSCDKGQTEDTTLPPHRQADAYRERIKLAMAAYFQRERGRNGK